MSSFTIKAFDKYVLRTAVYPLSYFFDLIENYSIENLLKCYDDSFIRESVQLASPELHESILDWKKNPTQSSKHKSVELSLLKYVTRLSSRCTPFGLFAGCSVGTFSSNTNIKLEKLENHKRHTQIDMHFWISFLQSIATRKDVIPYLTFYINNSIYKIGDFYRYVEYKYINNQREFHITAIKKKEVLDVVLLNAKNGIKLNDLINLLADNEDEIELAKVFILELIESQFLVSELDAAITGNDEWSRVLNLIKSIPVLDKEYSLIENLKQKLEELDKQIVPKEELYDGIKLLIKQNNFTFEPKYLFQTDLNKVVLKNSLNKKHIRSITKALNFLNGMYNRNTSNNLLQFVNAFIERYETREMPLTTVLDAEIGIGYLQNGNATDIHPILDLFSFGGKKLNATNEIWTPIDYLLEKKLQEALLKNQSEILLKESDFLNFNSNWENVSASFSVMVSIFKEGEKENLSLESIADISATKLLGRFCNSNDQIYNLTKEIVKKEAAYHNDKILAEIVHIPESRTGNVIKRPVLREFEIAYLSNPGVVLDKTIQLNDLMISVKNNRIMLRSKKHDKEVLPCLSNAHNFSYNSLPIYHFLCDLQTQSNTIILPFHWGVLENHHVFFPRIMYQDIILSKAKWFVSQNEINHFIKLDKKEMLNAFKIWKEKRKIPKFVNWMLYDNTLLLNLEEIIGIELFLKSTHKYDKIILEEFLFTKEAIVHNFDGEPHTNQFIVSFYKE